MEEQGPLLGHVVGNQIHSLPPWLPSMWQAPCRGPGVSKINPTYARAAVRVAREPHRKQQNAQARSGNNKVLRVP